MNRKRRREEEKMFDKVHQNHDLSGFDEAIKVLWNNNDFLYGRRVKSFDWIVDTLKYMVENNRKEKIEEYSYDFIHYSHMICYFSLIKKAIAFIRRNIENDPLHRYAFIQSLYAINGFSGGEKNEGNYRDNLIVAPGIDVVLGHSCCRHKAGMMKSILDDFDDALTVSVGDDENESSNHEIVSVNRDGKILFLDSTIPHIYIPVDDLQILDSRGVHYIKSVPEYIMNESFKKIDEYYEYFRNLYNNSHMSFGKYSKLYDELFNLYTFYTNNKELLDGFMEEIDYEQKEIKLALGRK